MFCRRRLHSHQSVVAELVEELFEKLSHGNASGLQRHTNKACMQKPKHFCTFHTDQTWISCLQARVPAVRDLVAKLCRFDHSLIPILGCNSVGTPWIKQMQCFVSLGFPFFFDYISLQLSLEVLDLNNRFECGGGWGLERTFNAWVEKQTWRQLMPVQYFQLHASKKCWQMFAIFCCVHFNFMHVAYVHMKSMWNMTCPRFEVSPAPVTWKHVACLRSLQTIYISILPASICMQPRCEKDMLDGLVPHCHCSNMYCYLTTLQRPCTTSMEVSTSSRHGLGCQEILVCNYKSIYVQQLLLSCLRRWVWIRNCKPSGETIRT